MIYTLLTRICRQPRLLMKVIIPVIDHKDIEECNATVWRSHRSPAPGRDADGRRSYPHRDIAAERLRWKLKKPFHSGSTRKMARHRSNARCMNMASTPSATVSVGSKSAAAMELESSGPQKMTGPVLRRNNVQRPAIDCGEQQSAPLGRASDQGQATALVANHNWSAGAGLLNGRGFLSSAPCRQRQQRKRCADKERRAGWRSCRFPLKIFIDISSTIVVSDQPAISATTSAGVGVFGPAVDKQFCRQFGLFPAIIQAARCYADRGIFSPRPVAWLDRQTKISR